MDIFKTLVEESSELFTLLDKHRKFLYVNPASHYFYGLSPDECIGRSAIEFIHPEDLEKINILYDQWVRKGISRGFYESRVVDRSGRVHYVYWKSSIQYDDSGEPIHIHCIGKDVSEQKELEMYQARSVEYRFTNERRLEMLMELNRTADLLTEKELCNKALDIAVSITESTIGYLHILNEDQNTIQLITWNDETLTKCNAVHDSHYPLEKAGIWADCAREKRIVVHNNYPNTPTRKGLPEGHFPLYRHMSAPVIVGGKVRMIVGVGNKAEPYTSMDERQLQLAADEINKFVFKKRAEEDLARLNRNLQERIREEVSEREKQSHLMVQQSRMAMMGEMIGMIAHQWKQPLSIISICASTIIDVLETPPLDRKELETISEDIEDQVKFMAGTLNDFYNFFKPKQKREIFLPQSVIEPMNKLIQARTRQSHIQVQIHTKIENPFQIYGNPNELQQVLLNLIYNSVDAMAEGKKSEGNIWISFSGTDDGGIISVEDDGDGIAPHLLPDRLFEPYVSTKNSSGSGIGLRICKLVVEEKLKGKIRASNTEKGALFEIVLPAADPVKDAAGPIHL